MWNYFKKSFANNHHGKLKRKANEVSRCDQHKPSHDSFIAKWSRRAADDAMQKCRRDARNVANFLHLESAWFFLSLNECEALEDVKRPAKWELNRKRTRENKKDVKGIEEIRNHHHPKTGSSTMILIIFAANVVRATKRAPVCLKNTSRVCVCRWSTFWNGFRWHFTEICSRRVHTWQLSEGAGIFFFDKFQHAHEHNELQI